MPQNYQTTISVGGSVSPSLAAAMKKVQTDVKSLDALLKKANVTGSGLSPQLQKATTQMHKLTQESNAFANSLKRICEIGSGVAIGDLIANGFERALAFAEQIADKLKEFSVKSLEEKAHREVLQEQQRAMLGSFGRPGMFGGLDAMMRNMEGQETMIKYDQLMQTANLLMSSSPKLFKSVDSIHKMLHQLADVSKDPEAFKLATQAVTRMLAGGKIDAKHLQELSFDTG